MAGASFNGVSVFSVWRMTADFSRASYNQKHCFVQWNSAFDCYGDWGKSIPGAAALASILFAEIYRKLKHITGYQSLGKLWCGVSKIKSIKNLWNTHIRICINCHYSYDEGNRRIRITRFRIMTETRIRSSQLWGTKQANIGESNILLWITAEEPIRKYWHHAPLWAWTQKTVVHNTVLLAKKSGAIRIPHISIAIDMAGPYLPAHIERKKCGSSIMP